MKRYFAFLAALSLCLLLAACGTARITFPFSPLSGDRTGAVIDVENEGYSTVELPETTVVTEPFKIIEVVVTAPVTAPQKPQTESLVYPGNVDPPFHNKEDELPPAPETTAAKEYFTVKFVDSDGYTALSVQTVPAGGSAVAPNPPKTKGDLIFRGWDTKFTNVRKSIIVRAIYQKEWLTVNFYDADGSLLKSEQVRYGEDATPPEVSDKNGYDFDAWSADYKKIVADKNLYATYYEIPTHNYTTLTDAYKILRVDAQSTGLTEESYYRKNYSGTYTIHRTDYTGNIIYGNFKDTLDIQGFDFKSFDGYFAFQGKPDDPKRTYSISLTILCDGEVAYTKTLTEANTFDGFSVDLAGVKKLTVCLEPKRNGFAFYENPSFIGGLINAVFYEK